MGLVAVAVCENNEGHFFIRHSPNGGIESAGAAVVVDEADAVSFLNAPSKTIIDGSAVGQRAGHPRLVKDGARDERLAI